MKLGPGLISNYFYLLLCSYFTVDEDQGNQSMRQKSANEKRLTKGEQLLHEHPIRTAVELLIELFKKKSKR